MAVSSADDKVSIWDFSAEAEKMGDVDVPD